MKIYKRKVPLEIYFNGQDYHPRHDHYLDLKQATIVCLKAAVLTALISLLMFAVEAHADTAPVIEDTCGQYYNDMDQATKDRYDQIKKAYEELKAAGIDTVYHLNCKKTENSTDQDNH